MRPLRNFKTNRCFHLISRVAHRAFYVSDDEKSRFIAWMWRVARFSGVKILAYCMMSNHFHILVHIPAPEEISDDEFLARLRALHSKGRMAELDLEWNRLCETRSDAGRKAFRDRFLRRMWNASEFMKTLKQGWTVAYNGRRLHSGTMWESRFRVREYEPEESVALINVAGYIDRNPVKAKIVTWPDAYEWCSYSAACKGDERCVEGYRTIYSFASLSWTQIRQAHDQVIEHAIRELTEDNLPDALSVDEEKRGKIRERAQTERQPDIPASLPHLVEKGSDRVAVDLLRLLEQGPQRPAQLRTALGIASANFFTAYYLTPLEASAHIAITPGCNRYSPTKTFSLTAKGRAILTSLPCT